MPEVGIEIPVLQEYKIYMLSSCFVLKKITKQIRRKRKKKKIKTNKTLEELLALEISSINMTS